jgi:hypothetical protein
VQDIYEGQDELLKMQIEELLYHLLLLEGVGSTGLGGAAMSNDHMPNGKYT